jgi:putative transposase
MAHSKSHILIHTIFSTKNRRPLILPEFRDRLFAYMAGVASGEFGHAVRIGGTMDHVHGLYLIRNDVSAAEAMRKVKCLSSRWLHKTYTIARDFAWQEGYGAFSVSKSHSKAVVKYIDGQFHHHEKRTFQEEFIDFLQKHEIEYDPASVWD